MKNFLGITTVLMGLTLVGCGGASSDNQSQNQNKALTQRLQSQSAFRLDQSNYSTLNRSRNRTPSSRSTAPRPSTAVSTPTSTPTATAAPVATAVPVATTPTATPSPTSAPIEPTENITITFTEREFFVRVGSEEILRGLWKEINDTTVEVTIEGEKFYVGVDLEDDDLQVYETMPNSSSPRS